jgi:hypothetical protein
MSSPTNWQSDDTLPQDRRDILLHGVQIAFGRLYASGAFGKYPNQELEVSRQAAFYLIDKATESHTCECGNEISFANESACDSCLCNEPLPETVRIATAHFGGHAVAECTQCDYKNVYWECNCSLEHDCSEY